MALRDFRLRGRWLLEATGAALLLLLPYFAPLVLPRNIALYHHRLPITNIAAGLLLDLAGVVAIGWALIGLLSRVARFPRRVLAGALAGLVCWRAVVVFLGVAGLLNSNLGSPRIPHSSGLSWAIPYFWSTWVREIAIAAVLLMVALAWLTPRASRAIINAVRLGLAAFAFVAVWTIPKLVQAALAKPANTRHVQVSTQPRSAGNRRIVWVLFDELSYNVLFDHRVAGVSTPNFDALRARSISFSNLRPAGFYTDRIIPSLFVGFAIRRIESTMDGRLLYWSDAQHRWLRYDSGQTLFSVARANGWTTGIAGWYNPYCRILRSVVADCSWVPGIQEDLPLERDGAAEDKSAIANALILPESPVARLFAHSKNGRARLLDQNIADYQRVMDNARALLQNGQISFVFLHLPVPHPPGFYNRVTHQLGASGDYLDNVVLADDTLGILMREIDGTPWAQETTLIVSSDHSWRVPLWRSSRNWTAEEERIAQGRFDPRPVLLIHFPGQRVGRDDPSTFSELIEYQIITAMLRGQAGNQSGLDGILQTSIGTQSRNRRSSGRLRRASS